MSVIEVSDELLKEAKNFLDQTWDDEASDEKLIGSLRRGIAYITAKTGVEASVFSSDSGDGRLRISSSTTCSTTGREPSTPS